MLNYFGQKFKDNGYQLMNDRDAPIWQNPGYWPITFRIIPLWHRVSTGKVAVDQGTRNHRITSSGFDLSGLDFHTGGTLEKNFSFYVLPSSDATASFHFETVMARLDNLFGSPWLNVKLGKFELDNLLSEKRILTLTGNGGIYQLYHFIPVGDGNIFGQMGDNQLGVEVMGHSYNDRTRYSVALLEFERRQCRLALRQRLFRILHRQSGVRRRQAGCGSHRRLRHGRAKRRPVADAAEARRLRRFGYRATRRFSREGFVGQFYFGQHVDLHGRHPAWLGQRLVRPRLWRSDRQSVAASTILPGRFLPVGSRKPNLERSSLRAALRVQPAADLHRAVRNDPHVAAGERSGSGARWTFGFEPGQHLDLHRRLSLQPVHDQPGGICLAQRVQLAASGRHRAWLG